MKDIIRQDSGVRERLQALISLFLQMEDHDGPLLEAYISAVKSQRDHIRNTLLDVARNDLRTFFDECATSGFLRPLNTTLMVTVLWGTCKIVAQTAELGAIIRETAPNAAQLDAHKAELIMDVFITGFGRSDP